MTKEGHNLQNPTHWLLKQSRRYGYEFPNEFTARVRADLQDISPAGNATVTGDLVYTTLFEGGERRRAAERLLVTQLDERNDYGFPRLGRFDRPKLTTTVLNSLQKHHEELDPSRRDSAKLDWIVSLVEPYLLRDKKTQKQLIEVCKQAGISCSAEGYTEEESAVYDYLEAQLKFYERHPTFGVNLAKTLILQAPLTIECGFDRLVGEELLPSERREGTSSLQALIEFNPHAPQIDAVEQFLQVFVLCDYNAAKAATYCQVTEDIAEEYIDRLTREKRISRQSRQGEIRTRSAGAALDDFLGHLQESGYNVKVAAQRARVPYVTARHHVQELVAQGQVTLEHLRTTSREAIARQKIAAQTRYETFMEIYHRTGSRIEAARAVGITLETARKYISKSKKQD